MNQELLTGDPTRKAKTNSTNDLQKQVMDVVKSSIADVIKSQLSGYSSPLKALIDDAVKVHDSELRGFIYEAIGSVFLDEVFRAQAREQIRHKVARELTSSFGEGIFKKAIDSLKGDPTIRARCVMAVEKIIQESEAK